MLDLVKQEILDHGDRSSIVPISRLQNIVEDLEDIKGTDFLNDFQRYIVNNLYVMDVPDADFEINSIIIIASPSPSQVKITFHWKGKRIPLIIPAAYTDKVTAPVGIEYYLNFYAIHFYRDKGLEYPV